jgi:hypothetical protein
MSRMIRVVESSVVPPFRWDRTPCFSASPYHLHQLLDVLSISWSSESDSHDGYRHTRVCFQYSNINVSSIVFCGLVGHFLLFWLLKDRQWQYISCEKNRKACCYCFCCSVCQSGDYKLNLLSALSYDFWFCHTTRRNEKVLLTCTNLLAGCNPRRQNKPRRPWCLSLKQNSCIWDALMNESSQSFLFHNRKDTTLSSTRLPSYSFSNTVAHPRRLTL